MHAELRALGLEPCKQRARHDQRKPLMALERERKRARRDGPAKINVAKATNAHLPELFAMKPQGGAGPG